MIVVDTVFLVLMIDPDSTQDNGRVERVKHFVQGLSKTNTVVMVPSPSIAELVAGRAEKIEEVVETLRRLKGFTVQSFDEVIAIETGERIAFHQANLTPQDRATHWKVTMKYDAMIAATAIVRGASELYTDDPNLGKYLAGSSVSLRLIDDLPLPPEDPQQRLDV
ncbi:PIN domain-containing protein [Agrobacterium sp. FDAARGOS_525]|uniref:type II toxin-antitoxin system VapC family toxin n=1 Tax=Agrobacterium sp. FDAARGOS_525 TaxID=2420311 RepID=UPI000F68B233|nr:PIN domain-containing protein [Agrobacterium sp. FDAARGOS_525]RSC31549.1 PIN domain-containing protein [Agrobacterium sp. FDAARGOS_525]